MFYVLSGQLRVFFGEDFGKYTDAMEGDFAFVPAEMPHIEANMKPDMLLSVRLHSLSRELEPLRSGTSCPKTRSGV